MNDLRKWIDMNASIDVKELPEIEVAYLSVMGPNNIEAAFQKLIRWARPKGLLDGSKMINLYHDSFKVRKPVRFE